MFVCYGVFDMLSCLFLVETFRCCCGCVFYACLEMLSCVFALEL